MARLDEADRQQVYVEFQGAVNMAPADLEAWLQTGESRHVGQSDDDRESVGHRSGRRIVEIRRKHKADLTDADYEHMREVVGFVRRHLAQRPDGDVTDSPWRRSLMNWGHDPLGGG